MIENLAAILAVAAALLVGKITFPIFLEDSEDFRECLRFSFIPDLFSLFRGEYFRDIGKSFKLSLYLIVMGLAGYLTHAGVSSSGRVRNS